uniref:Uncharacterized protein n=1 Tax=Romanomermis culicivorax TaxID=13658 RepID=A0A915KSI0_ROMCU
MTAGLFKFLRALSRRVALSVVDTRSLDDFAAWMSKRFILNLHKHPKLYGTSAFDSHPHYKSCPEPGHFGHPVAGKVVIRKSTCKSTKWTTGGADNLYSNGAPQKDEKMIVKSFLFWYYIFGYFMPTSMNYFSVSIT